MRGTGGRDRLDYRQEEAVPERCLTCTRTDLADLIDFGVGYRLRPTSGSDSTSNTRKRASDRTGRDYSRMRFFASHDLRFLSHAASDPCSSPLMLHAPQQPATTSSTDYIVGPQDRLSITVVDEPTLTRQVTVSSDGTFDYPYIGSVKAAGLSAANDSGRTSSIA